MSSDFSPMGGDEGVEVLASEWSRSALPVAAVRVSEMAWRRSIVKRIWKVKGKNEVPNPTGLATYGQRYCSPGWWS